MATRRRVTTFFVILLSLSSALLSGDAIPQGYHARHRRAHKCQTCPSDCPEKLAEQVSIAVYTPVQPAQVVQSSQAQYAPAPAVATAAQLSYTPHPTPAPYVALQSKSQAQQYSAPTVQPYRPPARPCPQAGPPVQPYQLGRHQTPYISDFNPEYNPYPYNDPADSYLDPYAYQGYDCPYGSCRCGRSLDRDNDYTGYNQYNRRSLDADKPVEPPIKPLPFADESSPPADFYKNYRPYVRDFDRYDDDSEEEPSRGKSGKERERLFVVYRADAFDDKPSDSELESVIRQAMDVARQQKSQENFARNARKPYRYHYVSQEKRQNKNERIDFKPLNSGNKAGGDGQRFNLSPGPLLNNGETYIAEEGDDALNPGLDQSKWTVVPSVTDIEFKSPQSEVVDEIEAAVSVVPEIPKTKIMKIPKMIQKDFVATVNKEKLKKDSMEIVETKEIEKKNEKMAQLIEDMPTPSTVTEATKFQKPAEIVVTFAPTTDVTTQ